MTAHDRMNDPEVLRAALLETERRLQASLQAQRRGATLLRAADLLRLAPTTAAGLYAALKLLRRDLGADQALVLSAASDPESMGAPTMGDPSTGSEVPDSMVPLACDPQLTDAPWPGTAGILGAPRRVADLHAVSWAGILPEALAGHHAMICAPVRGRPAMALVMLAHRPGAFTAADHRYLRAAARILSQGLEHRRTGDPAFEAVSRDLAHLANWQAHVVEITGDLLDVRTHLVDQAVDLALMRLGQLSGADRAHVFRLRDADTLANSHEWCAPGIAPMIDRLQEVPVSLLDDRMADILRGQPVLIPDVGALPPGSPQREILAAQGIRSLLLVPMLRDGRSTGFVGFDQVRRHRSFGAAEIQLLRSVAVAIGAVLDRATAETAAQRAAERLATTFAALPELVLEMDHTGRFTGCYAGAQTPPALPPEDFIGTHFETVQPPELASITRKLMAAVDRGDGNQGLEYALVTDGVRRWYQATAAARPPLETDGGGYVFVIRDITARREAERRRRLLERVAEVTHSLLVVTDPEQRIEWVNPAFEAATGLTLAEVGGLTPSAAFGAAEADPRAVALLQPEVTAGPAARGEFLAQGRDGRRFWLDADIQPITGPDGDLDGFVGVFNDITALKSQVEQTRRMLLAAIDASIDGIAITGPDGRYTHMNRAHRDMFAIPLDADVTALSWQDVYRPETVGWILNNVLADFQRDGQWRGELHGLRSDGEAVAHEIALTATQEGGILCVARDMSARLHASLEMARLRERLQVAQQRDTVAQLAGAVAHDLNNLIAVIAGAAEILDAHCAQDSEIGTVVHRVRRAVQAANDLVGGLASLGRSDLARGPQDLARLLRDAVELLGSGRVQRHAITLETAGAVPPIWANPTEVLQVAVNLALNACDAGDDARPAAVTLRTLPAGTRPPDRPPEVGAAPDDAGAVALFTVTDTGKGIPAAVLPRLFERNFTTKGSAGTGLGLPIVASILHDSGGALWVDTRMAEAGDGTGGRTTMTVAWPLRPPPSRRPPLQEPDSDGLIAPDALAGLTVLVVDDMADVAEVLARMLENAGAVTVVETDPLAARDLLAEAPEAWSAVLSDLHMPAQDGSWLAQAAAALQPPVPVVLISARPETVPQHGTDFAAVLSKPVRAGPLVGAVLAAARRRGTERWRVTGDGG